MIPAINVPKKTKSSYPLDKSEAKRHLRVDDNWHDDDDYISNLIKAATQKAEQYIGKDIAETVNVQEYYDWAGSSIQIPEGNFISFTSAITDASVALTIDETQVFYNSFYIEFTTSYSADPLTVTYKTGFEEGDCPILIKQAILVKIGDLYDVDRQSYTEGSLKPNKAFESLLDSFRLVRF